jgi:GT2 family glycosyltransferase
MLVGDELLIADNSPTASDSGLVHDLCKGHNIVYQYFSLPSNPGFGQASNFLAEQASTDFLVFLNPDAELIHLPSRHQWGEGITGALILNARNKPAYIWGSSRTLWDEVRLKWLRMKPSYPNGEGYVSGAAMALRKIDFIDLGGFSGSYFMYYEDIDICMTAGEKGIPVNTNDHWIVRHIGGVSARKVRARTERWSLHSSIIFHMKWSKHWRLFLWVVLLDSTLRIFLHLIRRDFIALRIYAGSTFYLLRKFVFRTKGVIEAQLFEVKAL